MTTDFQQWFDEYARPHFMNVLRSHVQSMKDELSPNDDLRLRLYDGDPGFIVPWSIVEQLLEEEEF